jgi:hypothetical protein
MSISRTFNEGLFIALSTLILISGCWRTNFLTYDDPAHISENQGLAQKSIFELFKPEKGSAYVPVTDLSYRLDRALFKNSLPAAWNNFSYAPGVRFMNCVYHGLAAILVWRIMLLLGLAPWQALFVGFAFAIHPLACETVCWISERKNALAGCFGFAALWAWLRWPSKPRRRIPVAGFLYLLACFSKPSALGLLPVFILADLINPGRASGAAGETKRNWPAFLARLSPFLLICIVTAQLNLFGFSVTLVQPPGGSVFTAALTDLEILSRYLYNLLIPNSLSAVYFVDPILSLADPRVWLFALTLAAAVTVTVLLSANRRRTIFAWLWLVAALGPSLNFVALPHFMQDRYIYLSTPAFFLILVDMIAGIARRTRLELAHARLAGGIAFLVVLAALSWTRSPVFDSLFTIFKDAAEKQPQAAFAHWGLGMAYCQAAVLESKKRQPDKELAEQHRLACLKEWKTAVDSCPDATRYTIYSVMALNTGDNCKAHGDLKGAIFYWQKAISPPPGGYYQQKEMDEAFERLKALPH